MSKIYNLLIYKILKYCEGVKKVEVIPECFSRESMLKTADPDFRITGNDNLLVKQFDGHARHFSKTSFLVSVNEPTCKR
jgi:hypothetical protein